MPRCRQAAVQQSRALSRLCPAAALAGPSARPFLEQGRRQSTHTGQALGRRRSKSAAIRLHGASATVGLLSQCRSALQLGRASCCSGRGPDGRNEGPLGA